MPDVSQFGLEKRLAPDGRLELIDKDSVGEEYVAVRCQGSEFTPADEAFLAATDRERSTPKQAVEFFTKQNEKNRSDRESALDDDYIVQGENVIRSMTAGQKWQWLRGFGVGDAVLGENGAVIPRRRKFVFDPDGNLVEQHA